MANKKITIVMPYFMLGGVEASVLRLCGFLAESYQIRVVVTSSINADLTELRKCARVFDLTFLRRIPRIQKVFLTFLIGKTDIIINSFDELCHNLVRNGNYPNSVYFVRNFHPSTLQLVKDSIGLYSLIICNSVAARRQFEQYHRNVVYIPNSVSVPASITDQVSSKYSFAHSGLLKLIYVGRLVDESKGIFRIPKIINQLPSNVRDKVALRVVGDGVDGDAFKRELKHCQIQLDWEGRTAHKRIFEFLADSHILIFTSNYEGMPNVMLEALSCGCVPVARRIDGVTDEVLGDQLAGLLWDEEKTAVEIISRLFNDTDFHEEMVAACRRRALEFQPAIESAHYLMTLKGLCDEEAD